MELFDIMTNKYGHEQVVFCNDKKQLGTGLWNSGLFYIDRVFCSFKERIFKVSQVTEVVCHAVLLEPVQKRLVPQSE